MRPQGVDVAVIGGGIVGMATALNLASKGRKVAVFDKGTAMGEASGVNAGSLGVQNKLVALVPYAVEALELWRRMPQDLGAEVGFRSPGGWRVATSESDLALLEASSARQGQAGLKVDWHDRAAVQRCASFLGEDVLAATFSPLDSYADPLLFATALRRAVVAAGVQLFEHQEIESLSRGRHWEIVGAGGTVLAEQVLIAAGAWTGQVLGMLGVSAPLGLDVNMVSVTEPTRHFVTGIVFHARGILTVKQTRKGTCLVGGGWQGRGSLEAEEKELHYEAALHNLRLAAQVIPGLASLHLVRMWSGFEGVTPDSLPYFGPVPGRSGIYVCACVRGGWTLGPLFGKLASEMLDEGRTSLPIQLFSLARVASPESAGGI